MNEQNLTPAEEPAAIIVVEEQIISVEEPALAAEEQTTPHFSTMSKEELLETLKAIVAEERLQAHREVSAMKQAFFNIRQKEADAELEAFVEEGNDPTLFTATACELEAAFKALHADFKEKRAKWLEEEENRRQANLAAKLKVIDSIKELMEDVDNINRNYSTFVELQGQFKEIRDIPAQAENDVWKQYQTEVERFYDLLKMNKELRDLDFKKNLEVKRGLIERAKGLAEKEDVIEAARELQTLHSEWRETGPVAKELRDEIWDEFKAASTVVNKRHQEYFDKRREQEAENEAAKTKLCEEVEGIDMTGLKSFAAWDKAGEEIKALQTKWKELGPASRKVNNQLFARFRKKCDEFFQAKTEYYKATKAEYKANLEKKEALCEKAEALKERAGEKGVREQLQALQAEWKTIGPTERKYSDQVWNRFTGACNAFFETLRAQRGERNNEEQANQEAKEAIIAKIKELPLDGDRKEVIPAIRQLQTEWQEIGHVPFKNKEKLYKEYRAACDAVYGAYEATRSKERMNSYRERLQGLRNDRNGISSERDRLKLALDRKLADLKTYENNMGFFSVKSSAGNAMLKELERKITKIKEEIAEIREKMAAAKEAAE